MNGRSGGLPDLAGSGRVVVTRWELLPSNGVDALSEGRLEDQHVGHIRVVDVPNARAIVAPINKRQAQRLIEQLTELVAA